MPVAASRLTLLIISSSIVLGIALGSRQAYGVLIGPYTAMHAWPIGAFAFVLALQNLLWGVVQPFTSAIADEWGAHWVAAVGGLLLALGLATTAFADSQWVMLVGSGILVGIGLSATSFALVLGVVGRAAPPERRGSAMGLVGMFGSGATMAMSPMADFVTQQFGAQAALLVLAGLGLAMVPMALLMRVGDGGATASVAVSRPGLRQTVSDAWCHSGFRWLTLGFFVCGFHVAFIGIHLPGYLSLCGMPAALGGIALAVLSGFNMLGSWGCGVLAQRYRPKQVLSLLYLLRAVAIILFVTLPVSVGSTLVFAAVMGMMWLGTVPLTNALIAGVFGTRYMATLFGIVFFSHQVGSFFGAWAGGVAFDFTGSYDAVWHFSAAIGVLAAAIHLPIKDAPLAAYASA
ncbi:MFS transporter [Azospirillum sp. sgz301742]